MTDRERLVEVIYDGDKEAGFYLDNKGTIDDIQTMNEIVGKIADKILADGWMRPPCKVGDYVEWDNGIGKNKRLHQIKGFRFRLLIVFLRLRQIFEYFHNYNYNLNISLQMNSTK